MRRKKTTKRWRDRKRRQMPHYVAEMLKNRKAVKLERQCGIE